MVGFRYEVFDISATVLVVASLTWRKALRRRPGWRELSRCPKGQEVVWLETCVKHGNLHRINH
jgi:hypothetical protein